MASGALDPIANAQAWDQIIIGGRGSPGVCKVGEFRRKHEFDVKKGKGTLGATITFTGRPPATGSVTFYLWEPSQFQEWESFRPLLKYDPTKKDVQAIDIYHPSLADIELKSVVVESIGNITHEGKQLYSIVVEFLEYFPPPPKSAVSTPSGSTSTGQTPGNPPGGTPDPIGDAQQKQIAELLAKASEP